MKTFALTLLYALSKADEITETNIFPQERDAAGFTVVTAQSQEQCDERSLNGTGPEGGFFDDEACACITFFTCSMDCGEGRFLSQTEECACINREQFDAISNHGLDENCQQTTFELPEEVDGEGNVYNIYNFYGPVYGDIVTGDDETSTEEDTVEDTAPAVTVGNLTHIDADGEDEAELVETEENLPLDGDGANTGPIVEETGEDDVVEEETSGQTTETAFEFNDDDDQACRDAVGTILDDIGSAPDARATLDGLYETIFMYRDGQGITLVDNPNLLQFKFLSFNRTGANKFVLPNNDVKAAFFTAQGATPFTTIEQLETGLSLVYDQRVEKDLETPVDIPYPVLPSTASCSMETMMTGMKLSELLYRLTDDFVLLASQGQFLADVAEFIGKPEMVVLMTSPYGYEFEPEDTAECIMNFTELEEAAFTDESDAEAQLTFLYASILQAKQDNFVSIIQNTDFVNWVMTFPEEQAEFVFYPESVSQWLNGTNGGVEEWSIIGEVMDAIFSARVQVGLEEQIEASIQLGYESDGCSTATVDAFNVFENQLIGGLLDGIKLANQEEFINNVIDWLSQPLPPKARTWDFLPNDGPTCRDGFLDNEYFLEENAEVYMAASLTLEGIYDSILFNVHEGCDLVDNPKFLMFITDNRVDEITDETRSLFLSEYGASPFTETDQLTYALSELYYQRVELGLEQPVFVDLPPFGDIYTCSIETQDFGEQILDDIYQGLEISLDLVNMEQYLANILDWIIEFNTPPSAPTYSDDGRQRGGIESFDQLRARFNWY